MKSKKNVTAASLCGELGPDDGIDPRILFSREQRKRDTSKKDRQLCREVAKALSLATRQLDRDGELGLIIDSVHPAPDASRLQVNISCERASQQAPSTTSPSASALAGARALQRLRSAKGALREELAAALHRKRVPELSFALTALEVDHER